MLELGLMYFMDIIRYLADGVTRIGTSPMIHHVRVLLVLRIPAEGSVRCWMNTPFNDAIGVWRQS